MEEFGVVEEKEPLFMFQNQLEEEMEVLMVVAVLLVAMVAHMEEVEEQNIELVMGLEGDMAVEVAM